MSFETAADSFIRPRIAAQATPAFAAVQRDQADKTALQTALRGHAGDEIGRMGGVETESREDFSFEDLLDVVNPLHHIPVVGTLYRKLTGDEIKAPAQVMGGLLYGGPVGMVASAANVAIEEAAGGDLGDAVYAMVFGPDEESAPDLATSDPAAVAAAAQTTPAAGPAPTAAGEPVPTAATPGTQAVAATATETIPAAHDADPAAQLPPVPAGALTGKAALDAFLNDLAGVGRAAQANGLAADGLPADTAPAEAALQAPPAAAQSLVPAAAQGPVAAPVAAHQVSARPEQPARSGTARKTPPDTPPDVTAVPPNLQDLGLRDRRGGAKPVPAVPYSPAAQAGVTAPRADRTSEPGITIRPGRASAGVDPRFLAPAPETATPLIDSGSNTGDFSQQMLQALQKYEDMLTARRSNARS